MATRYRVARQSVRFCKQTYHKGDLLPESFSERDMYRVLYPSRIEKIEVAGPEDERVNATFDLPEQTAPVDTTKGSTQALKTPAAPIKTTGASISGQPVQKK